MASPPSLSIVLGQRAAHRGAFAHPHLQTHTHSVGEAACEGLVGCSVRGGRKISPLTRSEFFARIWGWRGPSGSMGENFDIAPGGAAGAEVLFPGLCPAALHLRGGRPHVFAVARPLPVVLRPSALRCWRSAACRDVPTTLPYGLQPVSQLPPTRVPCTSQSQPRASPSPTPGLFRSSGLIDVRDIFPLPLPHRPESPRSRPRPHPIHHHHWYQPAAGHPQSPPPLFFFHRPFGLLGERLLPARKSDIFCQFA